MSSKTKPGTRKYCLSVRWLQLQKATTKLSSRVNNSYPHRRLNNEYRPIVYSFSIVNCMMSRRRDLGQCLARVKTVQYGQKWRREAALDQLMMAPVLMVRVASHPLPQ